MFLSFIGAYLKPPLNYSVISAGSAGSCKIKGEGGSSRVQRYHNFFYIPSFLKKNM